MDCSLPGFVHENSPGKNGLPCPPPGDLPDLGIEPRFPAAPALQGDSLLLSHWGSPQVASQCPNLVVTSQSALSPLGAASDRPAPLFLGISQGPRLRPAFISPSYPSLAQGWVLKHHPHPSRAASSTIGA